MSALTVVVAMLVGVGVAIVAVLTTVAISAYGQARRLRQEPSLGDVRTTVIVAVSGDASHAGVALGRLNQLSERYVTRVMLDLAPSLDGASRAALVSLGEQIGLLDRARSGVRSRRWSTRLYSARVLAAFGIESEDLYRLLRDRSAEVRAQAAAWCVVVPTPVAIEQLIALLDDPDGHVRITAQDSLVRIGRPAAEALVSALASADGPEVARLLRVAVSLGDERLYPRAMQLIGDPSATTRALAVSVLARTGDPGAGPALVGLLDDPSDDVVVAAAAGLGTLGY
jgi:HEAT repeat protein